MKVNLTKNNNYKHFEHKHNEECCCGHHDHHSTCGCGHVHSHNKKDMIILILRVVISLAILICAFGLIK